MPRIRIFLLTTLALVSILLCVATVALWIRSNTTTEVILGPISDRWSAGALADEGKLAVGLYDKNNPNYWLQTADQRESFHLRAHIWPADWPSHRLSSFGWDSTVFGAPGVILAAPLWFPAATLLLIACYFTRAALRRRTPDSGATVMAGWH